MARLRQIQAMISRRWYAIEQSDRWRCLIIVVALAVACAGLWYVTQNDSAVPSWQQALVNTDTGQAPTVRAAEKTIEQRIQYPVTVVVDTKQSGQALVSQHSPL